MTTIVSVVNHKGGCLKTTVTANLGAALARSGRKVLVVDLDSQQNLTASLLGPLMYEEGMPTLYDAFIEETIGYLGRINPAFKREWVLASHCHRYDFAQTICPPGFYDKLPPMRTPVEGLLMADTAYYYPEDRSITESVNVAHELVRQTLQETPSD